jgi:hypothetical protein
MRGAFKDTLRRLLVSPPIIGVYDQNAGVGKCAALPHRRAVRSRTACGSCVQGATRTVDRLPDEICFSTHCFGVGVFQGSST